MPKKKMVIPEDNHTVIIPESDPKVVRIRKIKTNSFSPLGRYYKGQVYDVPFAVYQEFERIGECEFVEVVI